VVLTGIREYLRPASIAEAWAALAERGKAARPIGGGIDALLYASPETTALVDLGSAEMSYVRGDGGLAIGATTTFTEMIESPLVGSHLDGILIEVLEKVASPLQRNLATIGGTLGSAHPWSDVIPLLLVLDAEVTVYDGRARTLPLAECLAVRANGERPLITEVRLPASPRASACAFEEYSSTGFDVAVLNCACLVSLDSGRCKIVRIAVGGTPALATRLPAAEEALAGSTLDDETIDRVARRVGETIDARDDRRASGEYRRDLARAGAARCLRQVAERLRGVG
jgi:CO/xanthine dehydrogenase FAD-binding subunit